MEVANVGYFACVAVADNVVVVVVVAVDVVVSLVVLGVYLTSDDFMHELLASLTTI